MRRLTKQIELPVVPVWLLPSLLTLLAALWRIGRPGLWADELATWGAARMPLGDLLRMVREVDAVNLVYYLLMHGVVRLFGDSETVLRLPAAMAMVATAGLVALLGRRLASYRAGLIAGLAFAVIPSVSRYAQEARAYAFVMLVAVAATILVDEIMRKPGLIVFLAYGLAIAALGVLHILALLLLPAHGLALALESYRRRERGLFLRWVASAVAGLTLVLPVLWMALHQQGQESWIPDSHFRDLFTRLPERLTTSGTVAGILIALAALEVSRRRASIMLLAWVIVPPILLFAISRFVELFWFRYLLFVVPALAVLAGLTLSRVSTVQAAAVLLALLAFGWSWQLAARTSDGHEHDTRGVGKLISTHSRPGDAIAYAYGPHEGHLWEPRDLVARYVPVESRPKDAFALAPQRAAGHFRAIECADTELVSCLNAAPRVWVLRFENKPDPLKGLAPPAKEELLRNMYELAQSWELRAFTVAVYERRS